MLVPVGLIGIWRWGIWLLRQLFGLRYQPLPSATSSLTLSIVTPVYNEDPLLFRTALDSWVANSPNQLIAVIDYTDQDCIAVFHEFMSEHNNSDMECELIVTQKPGKRAALADGILASTCDIVALVDSDTIWADDIRVLILPPFDDADVGGVGTRQNVLEPTTLPQRLFDVYLDLRYLDEIRFLAATGDALTCLSGRTAVYRRSAVTPLVDELVNETFLGKPVISGDDKCLTHLVQRDGWKVGYQSQARVYTPGADKIRVFFRQRLRWSRNSWRADLRALSSRWLWKRRALAFQLLDRLVQPITTLVAPTYFVLSLCYQQWTTTLILLVWWFVSRSIKILPHLKRRRSNIAVLPAYIFISYWFAVMRIYAFFTMNEQGWITRWDKSRFNSQRLVEMVPGYIGTGLIILLVSSFINLIYSRQLLLASMLQPGVYAVETDLPDYDSVTVETPSFASIPQFDNFGTLSVTPLNVAPMVAQYRLGEGDSEVRLTRKYGIERSALALHQDEQSKLERGYDEWNTGSLAEIALPFKDADAYRQLLGRALPIREADESKNHSIDYRPQSDTIAVNGRLSIVTLSDIYESLADDDLLEYEGDGVYLLKSNLTIGPHTILLLENNGDDDSGKNSVTWLKLKSDSRESVRIFGNGGNIFIDGITISSWDSFAGDYDRDIEDGRSYIRVDNGRMDIINSEIYHLGQPHTRSSGGGVYGLSWRIDNSSMFGEQLVTGTVEHTVIHNNYIGIYAFGATGMQIRHNDVSNSLLNGIEINQDSNTLLLEDNYISSNGRHGLLLSRSCLYNTIRKNRMADNGRYGLVLDRSSDFNTVAGNTISGNQDAIGIWRSNHNLLNGNEISSNKYGVRFNKKSAYNLLIDNHIWSNAQDGIYLTDGAHHNEIWQNEITDHSKGVHLRAAENLVRDNDIAKNDHGLHLAEESRNNLVTQNTLSENRIGLYSKTFLEDYVVDNLFDESAENEVNIRVTEIRANPEDTGSTD